MAKLEHLLSEGSIGSLRIKNRIMMTPMGSNLSQEDGHCGERIQRYYEERAKGGAGLLVVEVAAITWPDGACNPNQVAISDDSFLPGLTSLVERVHKGGAKAALQLQHAGKVAVCDIAAGKPLLVPSKPKNVKDEMMFALTDEEMQAFVKAYAKGGKVEYNVATQGTLKQLVADFASAAERAKRAGFDAIELHAGHGYILSSFLSPYSNQRTDKYGGSLENRARLLMETIKAVKKAVGEDFPVWCRLDAHEFRIPGGITIEDACATAKMAEQAGLDAIHVSAYGNPASGVAFTEAPLVHKPLGFIEFAKKIKKSLQNIPVIAVGRIEPDEADQLIANGEVDFIAMGRKLLADPELPLKLMEDRANEIRPCIYCYNCVSQIFLNAGVCCAVNPATGREFEADYKKTTKAKKIMVVGGGPAGMEAASIAALRGHQVYLYDNNPTLGGTLRFSAIVCPENGKLVNYLADRVQKLVAGIRLSCQVDWDMVKEIQPDAVIVASGAKRGRSDLPGADLPHVYSGDRLRGMLGGSQTDEESDSGFLLRWLGRTGIFNAPERVRMLSKVWMPIGRQVVIIGGGLVGVELAEFLAERGRKVVILEQTSRCGVELSVVKRWKILDHLAALGVEIITEAVVKEITKDNVQYVDKDNNTAKVAAKAVVLAAGASSDMTLAEQLIAKDIETHVVGDCQKLGYIAGAIRSGRDVACSI